MKSRLGSKTAVIGNLSAPAVMAPTPSATPAIIGKPGRCESAIPPAAPMNMAGKIGPPRKLLKEIA